jgi:hypothetical protein
MNHKAGDTVRVQSQEWIDAQEKDWGRDVHHNGAFYTFTESMQKYAGKVAKIVRVDGHAYGIDLDMGTYCWEAWMFDPDYRPEDEPLSAEDAIHAMLDKGETLYDEDGCTYTFNKEMGCFESTGLGGRSYGNDVFKDFLYHRPAKRNRPMTRDQLEKIQGSLQEILNILKGE